MVTVNDRSPLGSGLYIKMTPAFGDANGGVKQNLWRRLLRHSMATVKRAGVSVDDTIVRYRVTSEYELLNPPCEVLATRRDQHPPFYIDGQ